MRLFPFALLLAGSSAIAQAPKDDPGFAGLPGPVLKLADSVRIDLKQAKLDNPLTLFPGPKGGLIVYSQWSHVTAFDSMGRRIWSQDPELGDRRDIGEVSAFGWRGSEMWVSDASLGQLALLDQYGNVTKSIELPSWVRPTFSERKSFPVFEQMRVLSLFSDNSMLVLPRGAMKVTGATNYDENSNYILKVDEEGRIQRTIAKFPSNFISSTSAKGEKFRFQNPLNQNLFRVSPDGMHTVFLTVDTSSAKMDTVVIRAMNERGDTVYKQKFAYPAQRYAETQIDSIGRSMWGFDTQYREQRTKLMPRRVPTVSGMILDIDKTVWITLCGNNAMRSVVGIDATGKFLGKFQLPSRRSVGASNLGRIWVRDARTDTRGDLVRYKIVK